MMLRTNKILLPVKVSNIDDTKNSIKSSKQNERSVACSWILYAMREMMGMEHVRKLIIKTLFPNIKNSRKLRTFDAFQQYDHPPYDDKAVEILDYCLSIIDKKKYVVFTASNIQKNSKDDETHYQSFIVDNKRKKLYIIDPSYNPNTPSGYGIYEPEIAIDVIMPFFKLRKYETNFIKMTNPAQTDTNDVFCQSWSLYITLEVLNMKWNKSGELIVPIPKSQKAKYNTLLKFYHKILKKVPEICKELNQLYCNIIEENYSEISKWVNVETIIQMDATKLLFTMTSDEIEM